MPASACAGGIALAGRRALPGRVRIGRFGVSVCVSGPRATNRAMIPPAGLAAPHSRRQARADPNEICFLIGLLANTANVAPGPKPALAVVQALGRAEVRAVFAHGGYPSLGEALSRNSGKIGLALPEI